MGWIILGVIVLVIALILWFPVRIGLAYGEEGFSCWLKILFWKIPFFPRKNEGEKELTPRQKRREARKKARREKKKAKAKEKEDAKPAKPPKEKKKKTIQEWAELILLIAQSGGKLTKRFWKGFRVNDLSLQMAVAGGDAAETAITYGKINAAVYSSYALAERVVTLRRTHIQIVPDFLSEESRMEVSGELFFRVGTLLVAVFSGGFFFLKNFLAKSKKEKETEQDKAEQSV